MRLRTRISLAAIGTSVVSLYSSLPATAHHSFAKFERGTIVELEGEITDVFWGNPHVHFTLRGGNPGEPAQSWLLETNSPGILRRMGINDGMVSPGDRVLVAGNPTVNGELELNATNILLPDSRELTLSPGVETRFAGRRIGDGSSWLVEEGDKSRPELGLFRIWSSSFASAPTLFTDASQPDFTVLDYPLTPEGRRAVEQFDEVAGSERLASDCTPKGMPWIMEQPYDVMFERDGDDVLIKLEEFDVVRRIHVDWSGDRETQPFSIHGFSTGTWDGSSLLVETTNLNSPNFKFEIPASDRMTISERFTPTAEGDRLEYEITVVDPAIFTEPVHMEKSWLSLPDQQFDAYNCGAPLDQ
jgi:hypothetical protein